MKKTHILHKNIYYQLFSAKSFYNISRVVLDTSADKHVCLYAKRWFTLPNIEKSHINSDNIPLSSNIGLYILLGLRLF
jgi:hypothetical protein